MNDFLFERSWLVTQVRCHCSNIRQCEDETPAFQERFHNPQQLLQKIRKLQLNEGVPFKLRLFNATKSEKSFRIYLQ